MTNDRSIKFGVTQIFDKSEKSAFVFLKRIFNCFIGIHCTLNVERKLLNRLIRQFVWLTNSNRELGHVFTSFWYKTWFWRFTYTCIFQSARSAAFAIFFVIVHFGPRENVRCFYLLGVVENLLFWIHWGVWSSSWVCVLYQFAIWISSKLRIVSSELCFTWSDTVYIVVRFEQPPCCVE